MEEPKKDYVSRIVPMNIVDFRKIRGQDIFKVIDAVIYTGILEFFLLKIPFVMVIKISVCTVFGLFSVYLCLKGFKRRSITRVIYSYFKWRRNKTVAVLRSVENARKSKSEWNVIKKLAEAGKSEKYKKYYNIAEKGYSKASEGIQWIKNIIKK